MFQGIQRRLDGAGPPVETPVNAAQGVSNADLNQSRSPPPTNDPFMDTAPVGHRFDHSALGLYGDEGHAMYNFGGLQQSGTTNQMCPAHQFETSSSAGYDPHSTPFSEPGSRGHSIPPATPMIGEHLRGYSVPLTPSIHHGSPPFHHTRQTRGVQRDDDHRAAGTPRYNGDGKHDFALPRAEDVSPSYS